MDKVIKDRINHLKSKLKDLKQPKLGKRGIYFDDKIKELETRLNELNIIYEKGIKRTSLQ